MARAVLNSPDANSTEFDENTPHPVIDLMPEQRSIPTKGGTMRLGVYPCHLVEGTKAAKAYGASEINERHRHRWEFNNSYRERLQEGGLIASGLSPDGSLVEISELVDHPFMVGVQFHPELGCGGSKLTISRKVTIPDAESLYHILAYTSIHA